MDAIKLLIVEDERIVALDLKQRLMRLGYEVPAMVFSAEQAVERVAELSPDLVLMDIHLEGEMDGIEAARSIRINHHIPVVFLTAYSEEGTLARARTTQPYGYLLKPFSERELHTTIQVAIERHRADTALAASETHLRLALDAAKLSTWEFGAPASTVFSRSFGVQAVATEDIAPPPPQTIVWMRCSHRCMRMTASA